MQTFPVFLMNAFAACKPMCGQASWWQPWPGSQDFTLCLSSGPRVGPLGPVCGPPSASSLAPNWRDLCTTGAWSGGGCGLARADLALGRWGPPRVRVLQGCTLRERMSRAAESVVASTRMIGGARRTSWRRQEPLMEGDAADTGTWA